MTPERYILRASAPDDIGILADVMSHLASHRVSVTENHDFGDPLTERFFIWAKFEAETTHIRSCQRSRQGSYWQGKYGRRF